MVTLKDLAFLSLKPLYVVYQPSLSSGEHGLSEAIQAGVTGIAIKENDSQLLASEINNLLENKNELNQLGDAAYKRAVEGFTWKIITKTN